MEDSVEKTVRDAVIKIIRDTAAEKTIAKILRSHESKIHFVPTKYRVLSGLLHSLNIKFGNFIEQLLTLIVERDPSVRALPDSGRKVPFEMTAETDAMIDRYITSRQMSGSPDRCDDLFEALLREIVRIESTANIQKQKIVKDIDALFQSSSGQVIYLENKYNDDHDTGKFVDINRKFL